VTGRSSLPVELELLVDELQVEVLVNPDVEMVDVQYVEPQIAQSSTLFTGDFHPVS
jgi:hypothetical protein